MSESENERLSWVLISFHLSRRWYWLEGTVSLVLLQFRVAARVMGQLCHFLKLLMKGQSCLSYSGQRLKPLSGNHTVSLIFSSLTFKKLSCLELFFLSCFLDRL